MLQLNKETQGQPIH